MTYNEVETLVKEILAKQLSMDASKINSDSRLVEDLGIDSFGSVEVAFELEEKFVIKIPDAALYDAKTVKNIVDYIAFLKGGNKMAVAFSANLKHLFKSKSHAQSALPDNGFELPGTNGEAIILIHGMTGTPHEMRFLANYLNRQGYAIYCPRLANHGAPIHILQMSKWQDFYQTVRQCYLKIRGQHKHVYTSGLSMGALLALLLADEFKGEIAGVSCLSPTLFYDGWNTPWYSFMLPLAYKTPLKYFFYFKEEPPYGIKNEAVRRRIHEFYEKAKLDNMEQVHQYGYPFFPLSLLYQLEKLVKYLRGRLQEIDVPIQLIQAKDDDMSSVRNSQFIYNHIKSNRKELVLLHNSYHIITADQERNSVAMHMQRFFTGQPIAV